MLLYIKCSAVRCQVLSRKPRKLSNRVWHVDHVSWGDADSGDRVIGPSSHPSLRLTTEPERRRRKFCGTSLGQKKPFGRDVGGRTQRASNLVSREKKTISMTWENQCYWTLEISECRVFNSARRVTDQRSWILPRHAFQRKA